jgi:hypothetical protein
MSTSLATVTKPDALRAKVGHTLATLNARAEQITAEAIVAEVQADAEELALEGFKFGLCAALGPDLGPVAFADLTGHLGETDRELAARFGQEHSTVSRTLRRVRRNLGLPIRQPAKRRAHRRTRPALKEAA